MVNFRFFFGLLTLGCLSAAAAVPGRGTVYEKDSNRATKLYDWNREESPVKIQLRYTDPQSGSIVVREEVRLEGGKLSHYSIDHQQTNEQGSLDVQGDRIQFRYTVKGETKTDEEDLPPNLVVAPMLVSYLEKNREKLLAGDDIPIRLAVLDRRETVGFKLFKSKETVVEGKPVLVVTMKPSSFIVAALVDPLMLTLETDTLKLRSVVGRTLPKRRVDGGWKSLDAEIIYF